jgi:hypothetical protein
MEKKNKISKSNNKTEKKIEKEIKKELKKRNKPKVKKESKEQIEKVLKEPFLEDIKTKKEEKSKKIAGKVELFIIFLFSIIMLILLCNRSFFRTDYKNSKMKIDIPLLLFFKSDDGNKLVFKTLRKSKYVKDYFNEKLSNYTRYNCNGNTFYYDDINRFAIYDINVEKDFIVKTITIDYAEGEANCLCNAAEQFVFGKEAEDMCK